MGVAGGAGGPAAHYDFGRNTIYYNPRTARTPQAFSGVMEHELIHAATANIPGLSKDWRAQYLYSFGQAAQGKSSLLESVAIGIPLLSGPQRGRPISQAMQLQRISEGVADRSGAYPNIPKWGDDIRKVILGR